MAHRQQVVIGVFVIAIWIGGQAFSAPDNRRIVTFEPGASLSLQQTIVRLSGSEVVHVLGTIDGLAIKLPLIAVGATNDADQVTAYSLAGREVNVVAAGGERLGQRILSTYPGNRYGWLSGTSPAAAHVSGIVALLLQYRQLAFERVLSLLTQEAQDLGYPETRQGAGRVNAQPAVEKSNH